MWHAIGKKKYNYILAWTSVWIFTPAVMREVFLEKDHIQAPPWWFTWNIIFAAIASIWHWQTNEPYGIRHISDLLFSGLGISTHVLHLMHWGEVIAAASFSTIIGFFYYWSKRETSNILQELNAVNWTRALWCHVVFRYFAFWLSMYTYQNALWYPYTKTEWYLFIAGITTAYGMHLRVLLFSV